MNNKLGYDTDLFIRISTKVHNGKYDYSGSKYNGCDTKALIKCPIHGDFWQSPTRHMAGAGCPACGRKDARKTVSRQNAIDLIKECNEKFPWITVIEEKIYKRSQIVKAQCSKHGVFKKSISGLAKSGCKQCVIERQKKQEWKNRLESIYMDKFDFSQLEIDFESKTVSFDCSKHGRVSASYYAITRSDRTNYGCPDCGSENKGASKPIVGVDEFIRRAQKIHGLKYDYSMVFYSTLNENVLIRCSKHGFFKKRAFRHLEGSGCNQCYCELEESKAIRPKHIRDKRRPYKKDYRRARKYGVYYEPINRLKIFKRDKYKCQVCGTKTQVKDMSADNAATVGHIIPMSKGGSNTYSNTQCQCLKCNVSLNASIYGQQMTIFTKPQINESK